MMATFSSAIICPVVNDSLHPKSRLYLFHKNWFIFKGIYRKGNMSLYPANPINMVESNVFYPVAGTKRHCNKSG
jgi:hypothetical protein